MFDGHILATETDGSAVSVFRPWFERGGDHAYMILDLAATSLASLVGTFTVKVYHKNRDETGNGTQVGSTTISRDTAGREAEEFGPFKELVRYEFTIAASGAGDLRWALFRMLTPSWFDELGA